MELFEFCDLYERPESTPESIGGVFASLTFFPRESRSPSEFIDPPPSATTSIVGSISVESLGYWKFLCLLCLGKQFGKSEKGEKQIEKGFFIRRRIVREASMVDFASSVYSS